MIEAKMAGTQSPRARAVLVMILCIRGSPRFVAIFADRRLEGSRGIPSPRRRLLATSHCNDEARSDPTLFFR